MLDEMRQRKGKYWKHVSSMAYRVGDNSTASVGCVPIKPGPESLTIGSAINKHSDYKKHCRLDYCGKLKRFAISSGISD